MHLIKVRQEFHSVGHGTFFTGTVEGGQDTLFTWVYDCGSKRSTKVELAVENMAASQDWPSEVILDMVIVSHFDDDHINGLELLLQRHRVKWLVLPFMSLKARLAAACSVAQDEPSSGSMAAFTINPVKFLEDRGLARQVDSILFIRGGSGDTVPEGNNEHSDPNNPRSENDLGWEDQLGDAVDDADAGEYVGALAGGLRAGSPQLRVLSHQTPVRKPYGLPFELVFYNTAVPSAIAKRSKLPLSAVQKEVDLIFRTYHIEDPKRKPRSGWRASLKTCYTRHFGSTGPERNNISLCVMARPLLGANRDPDFVLFRRTSEPTYRSCDQYYPYDARNWDQCRTDRQALVLTGDLALDEAEIDAMKKHFGASRWSDIGIVQVPHHGSQHSWKTGNARKFRPASAFVQCIPTFSKHNDHPHPAVIADLGRKTVLSANYESAVVHEFYFRS